MKAWLSMGNGVRVRERKKVKSLVLAPDKIWFVEGGSSLGGKGGAFILGCLAFEMPMHLQKEITRTAIYYEAQKRGLDCR